MKMKILRASIVVITAFIALTAIGGGIAILLEVDEFPLEWLRDTPFEDYTIPALILAIVVGGSSLIAGIAVVLRSGFAALASMVAGVVMAGYIVIEVLILKQVPPGPTFIEAMYFVLGLSVFLLGTTLRRTEREPQLQQPLSQSM